MKCSYIKNNLDCVLHLQKKLNNKLYNIGYSWEDYLNGKYVELTKELIEFMNNNSNASIYEIYNMSLDESIKLLDLNLYKLNKIEEIKNYDSSNNVSIFCLNGIYGWYDKVIRLSLFKRLDIEKAKNNKTTIFWLSNLKIELSIDNAYNFLTLLEDYAILCFDITNNHIFNVNNLTTINYVQKYSYKRSYPKILNISYNNDTPLTI